MHRAAPALLALFVVLSACGEPEDPCLEVQCGHNERCEADGDAAACVCAPGHEGEACHLCSEGWQDNDGDGVCAPGCTTAEPTCGDNGACEDDTGTAVCVCNPGWSGPGCAQCAEGYVSAEGGCEPSGDGLSCETARFLDPRVGIVSGTNAGASDSASGSCQDNDGAERIYVFTVDSRVRARFESHGYDTVLHLRTTCNGPSTEVACDDDGGTDFGSVIETELAAGTYYLFVDAYEGKQGTYTLDYSIRPDPCAGDPCPGTPECVADAGWSSYACVCPAGMLPHGADCVDDPCEPNPCAEAGAHRTRCEVALPGDFVCGCSVGYVEEGGACVPDPDANEWTVMVFLNADNDLQDFGYGDVEEMETVGSTPYVHLVVLLDSYDRDKGDSRTLYVTKGGSEVLVEHGELDMGSWQTLRDFGLWTVRNYPARHYALFMWDHGEGWRAPSGRPLKSFSNDEHGNLDGISVAGGDYARALEAITAETGGKLDLVGFDACLMGMYEVAHATAPYARYFVGSSETEPATGWAWDGFLPDLVADPQMTPEVLGAKIVDSYADFSIDDSTLAVSDLQTMDALDAALGDFADELMAASDLYAAIDNARRGAQPFNWGENRDLMDFALRVRAIAGAPQSLVDAADALLAQLETTIVHSRAQSSHDGSHGLAVYFPGRSDLFESAYTGEGATWSAASRWDDFLLDFTGY